MKNALYILILAAVLTLGSCDRQQFSERIAGEWKVSKFTIDTIYNVYQVDTIFEVLRDSEYHDIRFIFDEDGDVETQWTYDYAGLFPYTQYFTGEWFVERDTELDLHLAMPSAYFCDQYNDRHQHYDIIELISNDLRLRSECRGKRMVITAERVF